MVAAARALARRTPLASSHRFRRSLRIRSGEHLAAVGGGRDGGWTVPVDRIGPQSVVYSGRVGPSASFELGLIELVGCEVHGFDATAVTTTQAGTQADRRLHLHPWEIAASDEAGRAPGPAPRHAVPATGDHDAREARGRSVPSLMAELEHDRLDVLKLDLQGSEYAVLDVLGVSGVRPEVLCVAFHTTRGVEGAIAAAAVVRGWGYDAVAVAGYDVTFVRRGDPTPR